MKSFTTIELLPKTSFAGAVSASVPAGVEFEQSPWQAVDIKDYREGAVWVSVDGLSSSEDVKVVIRTSNINSDNMYTDSGTTLTLTEGSPIQIGDLSKVGRFVRVQLQPNVTSSLSFSVHVVLHLQRS